MKNTMIDAIVDADGEQWTVPAGGGFGRAMKLGRQQVNLKAAVYGNVQLSMRLLCTE